MHVGKFLAFGAIAVVIGGAAVAQTIRPPQGNLTVAPASAADVALLQTRLQQLESAHNQTRTELAQARLELTATRNRLAGVKNAMREYIRCEGLVNFYERQFPSAEYNGVVWAGAPACGVSTGARSLDARHTILQRAETSLQGIQD
ncbi:hypothetical protein [Candidatus Viadribacter manganicus]|uniref:Uncharacterized protein n=1 Tax=Candidatus Viadribacter manganicus TaxID=1759059 RepID=A0A1B1AMK5_9PROT|nr:hypothetical protein [Candidatus Viadribacter manganicus]ANP47786.1 hypothetical protein ATE48_18725 [Candidatus Viadribacter manganicus]